MKTYDELRKINVNEHTEKKEGLTYLSWSWAWDEFKQAYPDAKYEIIKDKDGLPYFESHAGAMVYTSVTANNLTYEMWLPVMDSKNKAMKSEPYKYSTRNGEKTVEAFSMFDVNKALMRCLVKNFAMFGLALYIYSGDDLPEEDVPNLVSEAEGWVKSLLNCQSVEELRSEFGFAYKELSKDKNALDMISKAKDDRKFELEQK